MSLDITGSAPSVIPLDIFSLQILSGGTGQWNTNAQLSISPLARVASLKMTIDVQSSSQPTSTDVYYKVTGTSVLSNYLMGVGSHVVDLTSIKSTSMSIQFDLRNVPPYKYANVTFTAYDVDGNPMGTRPFSAGHL